MIKNNDAYRAAIAEIEQNSQIKEKTGGIVDFGILPEGFIETEDDLGKATFKIDIIGNVKNIKIKVHLSKTSKTAWLVHRIKFLNKH